MKNVARVIVVVLFMAATACKGTSSSNPLLGTWVLDRSVATIDPSCQEPWIFTAKTRSYPDVNGVMDTAPVTYVTGDNNTFPAVVYVMTDAGMAYHTTFRLPSKNKMVLDTVAQCPYVRK